MKIHSPIPRGRVMALGMLLVLTAVATRAQPETRKIALNPDYAASGNHKFWAGKGYRDLWTTPIELEVLDLAKEAGGLTVLRQVGGMQTPGLALVGADGRSYTFRWIDKDPTRLLPRQWRETVVADYVKDQTAASHPGVWPVVMSLLDQVGYYPFTPQRLVVMPDDPALGPHRELFARGRGELRRVPHAGPRRHPGLPGGHRDHL